MARLDIPHAMIAANKLIGSCDRGLQGFFPEERIYKGR